MLRSLYGSWVVASVSPVVCALALVAYTPQARAQTSVERDRQARAEFLAGREAFTRGNYEEAARRFEQAYRLSGRAQLLYNIGTSYDRLHRWVQARDAFRQYLDQFPDAPERDEVRARLAVIEAEIERERQWTERARTPVVVVQPHVQDRIVVRTVPTTEPFRPWRLVGLTAGGLAVLSGITGATIGLITNAHYDGLVRDCGMTDNGCPPSAIDDVALRATLVNVFLVGAAAMALTSVVGFAMDASRARPRTLQTPRSSSARTSLVPWIGLTVGESGTTEGSFFVSGEL